MCVCVRERDRERESGCERDRQTERWRETDKERTTGCPERSNPLTISRVVTCRESVTLTPFTLNRILKVLSTVLDTCKTINRCGNPTSIPRVDSLFVFTLQAAVNSSNNSVIHSTVTVSYSASFLMHSFRHTICVLFSTPIRSEDRLWSEQVFFTRNGNSCASPFRCFSGDLHVNCSVAEIPDPSERSTNVMKPTALALGVCTIRSGGR